MENHTHKIAHQILKHIFESYFYILFKFVFYEQLVIINIQMGRWIRPEVYPLVAAMGFVSSMVVFQLTRNVLFNPDVRVNKSHRTAGILENYEEGEKYAEHGLRKFLRTRPPEIMPALNSFFSDHNN